MRNPFATSLFIAFLLLGARLGAAQETVFNVPSGDVLAPGVLYLESDAYAGKTATAYLRAVAGTGGNVEAGLNVGAFGLKGPSAPFLDLALKWRPTPSMIVGTNAGFGVHGETSGRFRDLAYAALVGRPGGGGMRVGAGPCFATDAVFGRAGMRAMASVEYPIPGLAGWTLAADWFSGSGGTASTGLVYSSGRTAIYLAYGIANNGRADDVLTVEVGYTLGSY